MDIVGAERSHPAVWICTVPERQSLQQKNRSSRSGFEIFILSVGLNKSISAVVAAIHHADGLRLHIAEHIEAVIQ